MDTIVVNLIGVPGSGKSTCAAHVFAMLKMKGINVELITEFAKDMVWEDNRKALGNQLYVLGEQYFRMSRCVGAVDVLITDSPLILSAFYNKNVILGESFNQTVVNVFNSFDNITFMLKRVRPYVSQGRVHSEMESDAMRQPLIDLLEKNNIEYEEMNGEEKSYNQIVNKIISKLNKLKCDIVLHDN